MAPDPSASGRVFADANLFLRYLTNDIPDQADAVDALLERAGAGELTLVSTVLVLAEVVWTLERTYRVSKTDIAEKVMAILHTPGLEVVHSDMVLQAAVWYAEKNVDFIDALSAAWMRAAGVSDVYTFDTRHFRRFEHLRAINPCEE